MIERKKLVESHNPKLSKINKESPLTVGNGELAFTADVTGMQSLSAEYEAGGFPLCTMSQWGWHTTPVSKDKEAYSFEELQLTSYDYADRKLTYAVEEYAGNEEVYNWLRKNPHRLNLARIALRYQGESIKGEQLTSINQELELYTGHLKSEFEIQQEKCVVKTMCDVEQDCLGFAMESSLLERGDLMVEVAFPYGSPLISGANWEAEDKHTTEIVKQEAQLLILKRTLDKDTYYVCLKGNVEYNTVKLGQHKLYLKGTSAQVKLQVAFSKELPIKHLLGTSLENSMENTKKWWNRFWEEGGMISLHKSKDARAKELERRIVLSQYLLAIQSSGSTPPQETGLTCNSWYGKFHLEMHLWHSAWAPLFQRDNLLLRSVPWYQEHLQDAKTQAKRNGFVGAKWPKMIAKDAQDSPSRIATLLIWQQPHIMYMLELLYNNEQSEEFLKKYWDIMKESADYMADFAHYDEESKQYHLISPIIPAQEEHDPRITKNPTYELEYWKIGLEIASAWGKRLGFEAETKVWDTVAKNLALPTIENGLYMAHENCPTTFEKFNKDHPSMLGAYGLLYSERIKEEEMSATLDKVLKCWKFDTMWGWDFALMAMTAVRLGKYDLAVDILMKDTPKNQYVVSGNNYQYLRTDLPLYLPGNGSLLLAAAMMSAGYIGNEQDAFPKDGNWVVESENIVPFPY
jgi:Trehalose and maltose hydrolases (possible phosphorylases)